MKTHLKIATAIIAIGGLFISSSVMAQGRSDYHNHKGHNKHNQQHNQNYQNGRQYDNHSRYNTNRAHVTRTYSPGYSYNRYVAPANNRRMRTMPANCQTVCYNNVNYYRNGSTYYTYRNGYYEQVRMPIGARVSHLPNGTVTVWENGRNFYVANNTYFQAFVGARGLVNYEVVGYSY